jgi:TrmH family RNA methyltransferase
MPNIERITSRDNRHLIDARKTRDGKSAQAIFIEGRRLVEEAIRSKIRIREYFVSEGFRDREWLYSIETDSTRISELPEKVFRSIADTAGSQGIVAIADRPKSYSVELLCVNDGSLPVVLFLNKINNPSNLGAVMRTAEAAGVRHILISVNSADSYSPKALRAAMGATFRLSISDGLDLDEALVWAAKHKLLTTAADIGGDVSYTDVDWLMPRLLIFGSEARGLSNAELGQVDEKVLIPMAFEVESLNVAVSVGIVLFEAKRQYASHGTIRKTKN